MPIIPNVGRQSWRMRLVIAFVYSSLILLGLTMLVPFMMTVSSSTTNDMDYLRFWPVPRYWWSQEERFVKGLVSYFRIYPKWADQMRACLPAAPAHWRTWDAIGRDIEGIDALAGRRVAASDADRRRCKAMAADYSDFSDGYPIEDTLCPAENPQSSLYLESRYAQLCRRQAGPGGRRLSNGETRRRALALLGQAWGVTLTSFFEAGFRDVEMGYPYWQRGWFPLQTPKHRDFLLYKEAGRDQLFTPGVRAKWLRFLKKRGYDRRNPSQVFPVEDASPAALRDLWREFRADVAPAAPAVPFALRAVWYACLEESEEVQQLAGLAPREKFDARVYNRLSGGSYASVWETPFPVPPGAGAGIQKLWRQFLQTRYPLRLLSVEATAAQRQRYQAFLRGRFTSLATCNRLLGTARRDWAEFDLPATPPTDPGRESECSVWCDFVNTLPPEDYRLNSSEIAFQRYLLEKYGDLARINAAYGWNLRCIEEAFPPFAAAYAVTFRNNEWSFVLAPIVNNYALVLHFLLGYGNAVAVTLLLVLMTLLCTLTINPLAAYALSRFNLRGQDKVILFMLATMAFPAMVSAIPAYLLMRDLNLLNTFWALVLPGAANGMAIFILKGFFDSLPTELFEAATIDGAREWQIFWIVSVPLIKPILAVNALSAFLAAYNSWEWALIICQDKRMWTVAVWMLQASQWWGEYPWVVPAGFVVTSLPTFLVFIFCQKIILRGIILPSMK